MSGKSNSIRPTYKTEKVVKDNGTVVYVGRATADNMDTLLDVLSRLGALYVKQDGAIGTALADPQVIADLELVCSLLPIVGSKAEQEYLSYDDIKENWEQLILLFFNGGLNTETREMEDLVAGKISSLHFLPVGKAMQKALDELRAEKLKEAEAKGNV